MCKEQKKKKLKIFSLDNLLDLILSMQWSCRKVTSASSLGITLDLVPIRVPGIPDLSSSNFLHTPTLSCNVK